jgi:hypothetical protein
MNFDGKKMGFAKVATITVAPKKTGQDGQTLNIEYSAGFDKKEKKPSVYFLETEENDIFYVGLANKGMAERLNQHKRGCESKRAARKLMGKYVCLQDMGKKITVWSINQFDVGLHILGQCLQATSIELFEQSLIVLLKDKYKKSLVNFTRDAIVSLEIDGKLP